MLHAQFRYIPRLSTRASQNSLLLNESNFCQNSHCIHVCVPWNMRTAQLFTADSQPPCAPKPPTTESSPQSIVAAENSSPATPMGNNPLELCFPRNLHNYRTLEQLIDVGRIYVAMPLWARECYELHETERSGCYGVSAKSFDAEVSRMYFIRVAHRELAEM